MDARIALLLDLLDQAFDRPAWHGTNLRGSLRGLAPDLASRRPAVGRHSIWEITLHAAYWKFCVRRHVTGDRCLKFPRRGSDWPRIPETTDAAAWKRDIALLRTEHAFLREAVAGFPSERLGRRPAGLKWRYEQYIYGAASHDLYHAGQVQFIKRLLRSGQAGAAR